MCFQKLIFQPVFKSLSRADVLHHPKQ